LQEEGIVADRVGQQLGNYRLVRLLGQGGFAEVYLGEHIYLDTQAAIKVLHAQLAAEDEEQFRAEARTVAGLIHPHIVRILDYGVEGTVPFLVMDYAPHGTLRNQYPKGVPLPLPTVVSYITQLADALQYAHDKKVIHRDIKPENMLLGRNHEVLLGDFGIALIAKSSHYYSTQAAQDLAGTIAYMAPEQIQAQACPNSDQYSLAIVAYEWLSGARPFQGTFTEVAVKHTMVPPPSLRQVAPATSTSMEEVIMKALAKDPTQRYANMRDFANAIQQAYKQESAPSFISAEIPSSPVQLPVQEAESRSNQDAAITALISSSELPSLAASVPKENAPSEVKTPILDRSFQTPQTSQLLPRGISRRKLLWGLAGVAVASAVGGGAVLLRYAQEAGHSVALPASVGRGKTLFTYRGHSDWVWSVAWSQDGRRIASASGDQTAQVWDATSGDHLTRYTGHSDSVYTLGWSPGGGRMASGSNDKTVQVWDPTFGDHFYTYTGHRDWVWSVSWSPDGKRIASGGGDSTVQVWNSGDGSHVFSYRGHSAPVHAVSWSPDGSRIASSSVDGTVQVWNAVNGDQLYTFQPLLTSIWSVTWSPDSRRIATACDNKTVQVWDAVNGDHLYIYYGHTDFVYAVAWSPDGKRIASAGDDKTVQVWDAASGTLFFKYTGHSATVRAVGWAPDSKRIASGSWDKTVQVWQAE
jgi:WD40 repeat protein